jgi:hypothetical protein
MEKAFKQLAKAWALKQSVDALKRGEIFAALALLALATSLDG